MDSPVPPTTPCFAQRRCLAASIGTKEEEGERHEGGELICVTHARAFRVTGFFMLLRSFPFQNFVPALMILYMDSNNI
jgi:hypothetical protein